MIRPGAKRGEDLGRRRRVAEAHRQVAQPLLVADAANGRAAGALLEVGLAPGEELDQLRAIEAVARREVRVAVGPGEAVPGADRLAVVAAVDPVADQRPQRLRDRALVLDRQVRDAAPRVELVRTGDRPRRACVDAARARAATLLRGLVAGQRQVGVDLAQEEPRAGAIEEERVLAAPAEAALARELDLHHRRRIGEHPIAERPRFRGDAVAELLQSAANELVIVAPPGVTRYHGIIRLARNI